MDFVTILRPYDCRQVEMGYEKGIGKIFWWAPLAAVMFSAMGPVFAQSPRSSAQSKEAVVGIAIPTQLVSLTVTVTDNRGRYFTELDKDNFTVFDSGIAQEISFFSLDDGPATVGIVFDLSGSMNGGKIERAKDALARFIETGHPDDEYSLVGFNDRPLALREGLRDGYALLDGVSRLNARGNTALFDAISTGLEQVMRGGLNKRAIIVISDGQDNRSRTSLNTLKRTIGESGVIVYAVLIKDPLPRFQGEEMQSLAESSGGLAFNPSSAEQMAETFDRIAIDLRRRYSIGYSPSNFSADNRWRRLKVKVTAPADAPHLIVTSRKGYFATKGGSKSNQKAPGLTNSTPIGSPSKADWTEFR